MIENRVTGYLYNGLFSECNDECNDGLSKYGLVFYCS